MEASEQEWRDCARAAGLPVSRSNLHAVVEPMFQAKLQQAMGSPGQVDRQALADLQSEEKRLAVAIVKSDQTLRAEQLPRIEAIEQTWASKNGERLNQLRDALLQADERLRELAGPRDWLPAAPGVIAPPVSGTPATSDPPVRQREIAGGLASAKFVRAE